MPLEFPSDLILKPGDVGNTAGDTLLGYLIRRFSTTKGEEPSQVNHSFVVVKGGTPDKAEIVEALSTVKRHPLVKQYGGRNTGVEIWRPAWLTDDQREKVAWAALGYVNLDYGYHKIAANAIDRLLFGGRAVARDWFSGAKQPICSHLVGLAFEAVEYTFGHAPHRLQPDDIADWVRAYEYDPVKRWDIVMPLAPLKDWKRWHAAAHREV
jgi:hypothetical protein